MSIFIACIAISVFIAIAFFIFGYALGKITGQRQQRIATRKRRNNIRKRIIPWSV